MAIKSRATLTSEMTSTITNGGLLLAPEDRSLRTDCFDSFVSRLGDTMTGDYDITGNLDQTGDYTLVGDLDVTGSIFVNTAKALASVNIDTGSAYYRSSNNATGSSISFYKDRTGSNAVVANDEIGYFTFYGSHNGGTTNNAGASIRAYSEGTFSSTSSPARLEFWTTPTGSITQARRISILNDGKVGIRTSSPTAILEAWGSSTSTLNYTFAVHNSSGTSNTIVAADDGGIGFGITPATGTSTWFTFRGQSTGTNIAEFGIPTDTSVMALSSTGVLTVGHANNGQLTLYRKANNVGTHGSYLHFDLQDSGSAQTTYSQIYTTIVDNTNGSEDGRLNMNVIVAGTLTEHIRLTAGNVGIGDVDPTEKLHVNGNIKTAQGGLTSAGSWKLGTYLTTAPSATGYIEVEIGGVLYKLLANNGA